MCLAIGPMHPPERGGYSRYWWTIAQAPHKLFLFSVLLHSALLLLLYWLDMLEYPQHAVLLSSLIFYALPGFGLLGVLLNFLPQWLHTSSIDYSVYGSSYNLAFIGMFLVEIGLFVSESMLLPGILLLSLSWLLAANAMKWCFQWTLHGHAGLHRAILILLYLVPLSLLVNMACISFTFCLFSPSQIFYKDLLLVTLLLLAFVASFVSTKMPSRHKK